jgi:hypothetical protein
MSWNSVLQSIALCLPLHALALLTKSIRSLSLHPLLLLPHVDPPLIPHRSRLVSSERVGVVAPGQCDARWIAPEVRGSTAGEAKEARVTEGGVVEASEHGREGGGGEEEKEEEDHAA